MKSRLRGDRAHDGERPVRSWIVPAVVAVAVAVLVAVVVIVVVSGQSFF